MNKETVQDDWYRYHASSVGGSAAIPHKRLPQVHVPMVCKGQTIIWQAVPQTQQYELQIVRFAGISSPIEMEQMQVT
jgi:hypothetical protein